MRIRRAALPRIALLFALSILFSPIVVAQVPDDGPTSLGFSASDSTQPVRDYRLPSWHWSRWTLDGGGGVGGSSSESDIDDQSNYYSRLSVNPAYEGFWESEQQTASLAFSPTVTVRRSGASSDSHVTGEQEQDHSGYRLSFDGEGTFREYVSGQTFLLFEGDGNLFYRRDHEERGPGGTTQTQIRSNVDFNTRLGVGVGRVRIVTPVVRALRVRERLRTVAPGASMSEGQVQTAAQQLARRSGYEAVYDRPDKAFWRDFFDGVGISERSTFETFYVADVLREPVGVRREGADLVAGPYGRYSRFLERTEENNQLDERSVDRTKIIGGFVRGRWYRNVSLRHQLGVEGRAVYSNPLEGETIDYRLYANVQGQWLWVLADRVRLETNLNTRWDVPRVSRGDDFRTHRHYSGSSDLQVFVENRLSLSVGGNLAYSHGEKLNGGSYSNFRTGIQFSVNYVLSRSLR